MVARNGRQSLPLCDAPSIGEALSALLWQHAHTHFAQAQNAEARLRAHSVWNLGTSRRRWAGPRWAEPAVRRRADTAQAPAPWPQPGARLRRVPLPAGRGVARTRASRRDVLRRATPDITGLCVVAARLSSAASPGEGCAAFAGGAAGDKDYTRRTIQWQSRRFRFAASPAPDDAGPWLPPHRPSLPRGPGAAAILKR